MAATSSASAAAVAFVSLPFPASTTSSSRVSASTHRGPRPFRAATIRCSSASPNVSQGAPVPAPPKPQIELEFVGPNPGADGSYPVDRAEAASGDKLLRDIMNENKIELYAAYVSLPHLPQLSRQNLSPRHQWVTESCLAAVLQGKVMNCGGGGSCGTCIVEILDGKELLNERTNTENRYLKKVGSVHFTQLRSTSAVLLVLDYGVSAVSSVGCGPTAAPVEEMIVQHHTT
ncbi:hypothetical protein BAE44_0008247 [Dichanthelium oligosanthes]|uniref:2Fe-2S ferredoxin-type domain-containing protein n=1 Tax=Dichanthelium oligosanthes TaxID=888268 RepID=A0A1E5W027_9POAL|nr:hypothetical protein BAE44_0008247 [Dichanthelium oligosanthes]